MRLTIGKKLGIVTAITLIFMLVVIAANVAGLNTVRTSSTRSVEQLRAAGAYKDLVNAQGRAYSALFEYVADGEADDLTAYESARDQAQQLTEPAVQYCSGCHPSKAPDIKAILTALRSQQDTIVRLLGEALAAHQANPADAAVSSKIQAAEGAVASQLAVADGVQTSHAAFIDQQLALDDRQAVTLLGINIALGLLALVVAAFLAIRISGGIVRSITNLRNAADGMSRGELDAPIELKTGDEMEDMAASIERMRLSLKAAMDRLRSRTSAP
jgi:HAMP domain-containing protein